MAVGATGFWKFLSFFNALLVAAFFGVTLETDVYFYLLFLIGLLLSFIQTFNTTSIIPQAIVLEQTQPGEGRKVLNFFLLVYMIGSTLLFIAGILFPTYLIAGVSRFSVEQVAQFSLLVRLSFLLFGLQLFTNYFTSILEMYHRFSVALLSPLNAIIPLICLLLWGKKAGIISMMYGFVLSYAIQTVLLGHAMHKELQWNLIIRGYKLSARLKNNLFSIAIQSVLNIVCSWVPLYLLSGLGVGWISALNYARQLAETPSEILTQRITNLSKIQLTEQVAKQDWKQGNINYLSINHWLIFTLAPLTVFSCFYAPEIIIMFFKRGAFTMQDAVLSAGFLRPLLFVMLFMVPGTLQTTVLSSTRTWKEFLPYSFIGYGAFLVAIPITMHIWGGLAYPYTLLATNLIGTAAVYICARKYAPAWDGPTSLKQLARILSLNIIALVPAAVYGWYFAGPNPWSTVFIGGIIFMGTLCALSAYSGDLQFFIRQSFSKSRH